MIKEAEKIVQIIKDSDLESVFKKDDQEIEKDESIQLLLKKFDASKEKNQSPLLWWFYAKNKINILIKYCL